MGGIMKKAKGCDICISDEAIPTIVEKEIPIMSSAWVLDSLEKGKLLDYEDYILFEEEVDDDEEEGDSEEKKEEKETEESEESPKDEEDEIAEESAKTVDTEMCEGDESHETDEE